ncbi:hypothetical protein F5972_03820 [Microbispora cellulosiformans]|uniref:Uncharacterized protein n=1 Tax=Microbispora cellulosiformans TaxID=2614688 RepID=A0A5J5KAS0_9ACTN|nr:hypothetical protein [Microbispora cellulosiformans]KAA9381947.1 hypothetical protein F5972_03820 [Microbispora cellulosiformans]
MRNRAIPLLLVLSSPVLLGLSGAEAAQASVRTEAGARAGNSNYSALYEISAVNRYGDRWRSTRNSGYAHGKAQSCVRTQGYDFFADRPNEKPRGWFFSLRKPNSDRIWASKDYKSNVRKACSPRVNRRGTFYTRVTVHPKIYLRKAEIWQYWT